METNSGQRYLKFKLIDLSGQPIDLELANQMIEGLKGKLLTFDLFGSDSLWR